MVKNKRKGTVRSSRKIDVSAEERVLEARNVDGDKAAQRKAKTLKFFVDKKRGKVPAREHWAERTLRRDTLFEDADRAKRELKAAARAGADAVPAGFAPALAARTRREAEARAAQAAADRARERVAKADARGVYDLWDTGANNGKPRDCPSVFRADAAPGAPTLTAAATNEWLAHVETAVPRASRTRQETQSALPSVALPRTEDSFRPSAAAVARRVARAEAQHTRAVRATAELERRIAGTRIATLLRHRRGRPIDGTTAAFIEAPSLPDGTFAARPGRSDLAEGPKAKKPRRDDNDDSEDKDKKKEEKKKEENEESGSEESESEESDKEMDEAAEAMLAAKDALREAHMAKRRARERVRHRRAVAAKDLAHIEELAKETDRMLQEREAAAAKRLARRAAWRATHGLKFGTHRYRPAKPSTDVEAAGRTAASLRGLRSEGSLLRDRLDSYKKRNIVLTLAPRPRTGRRKIRLVERSARRIPAGLSHAEVVEYIAKL